MAPVLKFRFQSRKIVQAEVLRDQSPLLPIIEDDPQALAESTGEAVLKLLLRGWPESDSGCELMFVRRLRDIRIEGRM